MNPRVGLPAAIAEHGTRAPGDTIAAWLLDGPAQLRDGPHAGAIAGTIAEAGAPAYVYPEIAGYYLQWLAWRARTFGGSAALAPRADAVQRWLAAWLAHDGPPPTRVHLAASGDDWLQRRRVLLRRRDGRPRARSAAGAGLDGARPCADRRRVAAPRVADRRRRSVRRVPRARCAHDAAGPMVDARGAFPREGRGWRGRAARCRASRRRSRRRRRATFAAAIDWTLAQPHPEAHPRLYACEGLMALPEHPRFRDTLPAVGAQLARASRRTGRTAASRRWTHWTPGTVRRASTCWRRRCASARCSRRTRPDTRRRPRCSAARATSRIGRCGRPGSVAFAVDAPSAACNVWAAMFADQALLAAAQPMDAAWRGGDPLLV